MWRYKFEGDISAASLKDFFAKSAKAYSCSRRIPASLHSLFCSNDLRELVIVLQDAETFGSYFWN